MQDYIITTDNQCDLPDSFLEEHGIGCTYLSYTMDGVHYTHGNFMPIHDFYDKMRAGSMPTTAQINPAQARDLFEPYLKEGKDVLHLAFSSGLSGTCDSARIAAQELQQIYPDRKIVVVDTLAASLGQGLLVYYAQMKKEQGEDFESVRQWVESHKKNLVHLFTVDNLFHLHRGGRVSKTTAVVGTVLNIKPVLHVDDEGHLVATGKVRGRKKSLLELVRLMEEQIGSYRESCDTIFISHGDCEEEACFVRDEAAKKFHLKTVIINHVCPTIGAHSGPGTMALFFLGDRR